MVLEAVLLRLQSRRSSGLANMLIGTVDNEKGNFVSYGLLGLMLPQENMVCHIADLLRDLRMLALR